MSSVVLDAAKQLCDAGIKIFPTAGKKPLVTAWQDWATSDFDTIAAYLRKHPNANLAMPTGAINGIDVWDIDGEEGRQNLAKWQDAGNSLPKTIGVLTGSGGYHFYFKHTPGLRNSAKQMMPGWDTRGDGGYVVIPPSIHPETGRPYAWYDTAANKLAGFISPEDATSQWPEILLEMYFEGKKKKASGPLTNTEGKIPLGVQEDTLTSLAGTLRRKGASVETIEENIVAWGQRECNPPMQASDALRIARSIGSRPLPDVIETITADDESDHANALRLLSFADSSLRYATDIQQFIRYNGTKWVIDDPGAAKTMASRMVTHYRGILNSTPLPDGSDTDAVATYEKLIKIVRRLRAQDAHTKMIKQAEAREEIQVRLEDFDQEPYAIYFPNGRLDYNTHELQPPNPDHHNTRVLPFEYDPEAEAPRWHAFIEQSLHGDAEMVQYIQELCGIFLLGRSFKALPIVYGPPHTGKSVFVKVLMEMMGEYAKTLDQSVVAASSRESNPGAASPHLMALRNVRLAVVSELAESFKLNDMIIKVTTGGNRISARQLQQGQTTFAATHKLLIETNEAPYIPPSAGAMWDRVHVIPFDRVVDPKDRIPEYEDHLVQELPGIFNWAYEGLQRVMAKNMQLYVPPMVRAATSEYREAINPLAEYFEECCIFDLQCSSPEQSNIEAELDHLYAAYKSHCMVHDVKMVMGKPKFGIALSNDPRFYKYRSTIGRKPTMYRGISLRTSSASYPGHEATSNITRFERMTQAD